MLIVSSSMGAGHRTAADALAAGLTGRGVEPRVVDWLQLPGGRQGSALRGFYRGMLEHTPAGYELAMRAWGRWPGFFESVTAAGDRSYRRGFHAVFDEFRPQLVVATYNLAGQALGRMRRSGELTVPLVVAVTDAGPHPYWCAPAAALHLAPLAVTAEALRSYGAGEVQVTAPLVTLPAAPIDRERARQRWALEGPAPAVLVSGGSWGVGAVVAATRTLVSAGLVPVVLCGRSAELLRDVGAVRGARAIGWTDDVAGLLAGCDVVVDSGGGATAWEALLARRPLVLHSPIPGHGRLNAETLRSVGLAQRSDDGPALIRAISAALADRKAAVKAAALFAQSPAAEAVCAVAGWASAAPGRT